jgi:predicted nucleic acid-binding protein
LTAGSRQQRRFFSMILLDADVCIDLGRGYLPALEWFAGLMEHPALPGLVVMELLAGCRNGREMQVARRFTRRFEAHWPTAGDCGRAVDTYTKLKLSHGLSVNDALIAACAIGLGATLCTFNVKHFSAIVGLSHQQPYPRR